MTEGRNRGKINAKKKKRGAAKPVIIKKALWLWGLVDGWGGRGEGKKKESRRCRSKPLHSQNIQQG